ncbi:MAG: hypothetical protein ACYTDW_12860 [Planctomycetota bacterium]|jgi:hypothetical protein
MQKKKIIAFISGILILLTLLIAISISRLERPSQEYSQQLKKLPYTFDFGTWSNPNPSAVGFDGTFPKVPSEMMVYKVIHPNNINESYVRELAQKHFGMPPGAKMERSPNLGLYWLETSTRLLEVNPKTGFFNIEKIDEIDTSSTTRNDYPSKEDCNIIAVKYLKNHNLYEEDAYFRSIVDKTKSSGVMSVGFGRKIGGYKNWGTGGCIYVRIGPGGEVVQVRKSWQELVPYKPYPIKTAREALKDLHNRKGFLTGRKGKIKSITLKYYTSSEKQDYVQPIYRFECTGPEGDFSGLMPAIKDKYLQSKKEYWEEIKEKLGIPNK